DGIRDPLVTGVQTCALPISRAGGPAESRPRPPCRPPPSPRAGCAAAARAARARSLRTPWSPSVARGAARAVRRATPRARDALGQIGRASCRERGQIEEGGGG